MNANSTLHGPDLPENEPIKNDNPPIWNLVMDDMARRNEMGIKKYGTPLQAFNGRDSLWDAYQESLDLVVYLRQTIAENPTLRKESLIDAVASIKDLMDVQCLDGNWNYSPYMMGLANGLILAYSVLNGIKPEFKSKPKKWNWDGVDKKENIILRILTFIKRILGIKSPSTSIPFRFKKEEKNES